jgi:hypothetical protein
MRRCFERLILTPNSCGGFGAGFIGGLALGATTAPCYYRGPYDYSPYAYEPDRYIRREVFINHWGHRVVRHIRVCY